MEQIYKNKYLKYKNKYLNLKSQFGYGNDEYIEIRDDDDDPSDNYLDILDSEIDSEIDSKINPTQLKRIGAIKKRQQPINVNPQLGESAELVVSAEEQKRMYDKLLSVSSLSEDAQHVFFNKFLTKEQSEIEKVKSVKTPISAVPIGTMGMIDTPVTFDPSIVPPSRKGAMKKKFSYIPTDETNLIDCYIASSHNTYFEGKQLTGNVDVKCYVNFLKYFNGGCIEFDPLKVVLRKKNDELIHDVKIGHKSTPTNTLYLTDILFEIKQLLDDEENNYIKHPIIFSFDNKDIKKYKEHQIIWSILKLFLDKYLYKDFNDTELQLKNINKKILIKWKQCTKKECLTDNKKCKCLQLIKPESSIYNTTDYWTHMNQENTISLVDNHAFTHDLNIIRNFLDENSKKIKISKKNVLYRDLYSNLPKNYIIYNILQKFIRKYPSGTNISSGNYPFITEILYGVNMVALNMQKQDIHTMMMIEFFRETGIRLKPSWMTDEDLKIVPTKEYNIFLSDKFKDINIFDENEKIYTNLKTSSRFSIINMIVTSEIEIIYIKLKYEEKIWHGAITLNRTDNILYLFRDKGLNCDWLSETIDKLEIKIKILKTFNDIISIEIIPIRIYT
jgi:hypothetical protein